jgi:hypothetical protein
MNRPWKVIHHQINDGRLVERTTSFATLERAVGSFKVAVLFDFTARLEFRDPDKADPGHCERCGR